MKNSLRRTVQIVFPQAFIQYSIMSKFDNYLDLCYNANELKQEMIFMRTGMKPAALLLTALLSFGSISSNFGMQTLGYDELHCDFNADHTVSVADAVYLLRLIQEDDTMYSFGAVPKRGS